jgi:omega-6 fatty acid desaturase (delta-12 desaturase)
MEEPKMSLFPEIVEPAPARPDWYQAIARYERPSLRKAVWQILDSLVPYLLLWYVMIRMLGAGFPYGAVLLVAVPASLFMVRVFILFHDCTHGSFFASKRVNSVVGTLFGILTFVPFEEWRDSHWKHHATVADLDRRGQGDVWTMTREEFIGASGGQRLAYRLYRNPFIMFGLGPLFSFLVYRRFVPKGASKRARFSVYLTDLAVLGILLLAHFTIGLRAYFLIQLPILFFGGMLGFWLFYVQHQFEGVYWSRHEGWDRMKAALEGSSSYKLPAVLRWFTGNIGYHSVHHVRPLIPNYNLRAAHETAPALRAVKPLTIRASLHSLRLRLWDEETGRLVGYRAARAR